MTYLSAVIGLLAVLRVSADCSADGAYRDGCVFRSNAAACNSPSHPRVEWVSRRRTACVYIYTCCTEEEGNETATSTTSTASSSTASTITTTTITTTEEGQRQGQGQATMTTTSTLDIETTTTEGMATTTMTTALDTETTTEDMAAATTTMVLDAETTTEDMAAATTTTAMDAETTTEDMAAATTTTVLDAETTTEDVAAATTTSAETTVQATSHTTATTASATTTTTASATTTTTTSTATTGTVTTTQTTTSVTVSTTTATTQTPASGKGQAQASAAKNGAASALAKAKAEIAGLGNQKSKSVATDAGTLTVFSVSSAAASGESAALEGDGGTKVSLSPAVAAALPSGAVIGVLSFSADGQVEPSVEDDPFKDLQGDSGEELATPSMDITVFDSDGNPISVALAEPLLFKLPGSGSGSTATCVFLKTLNDGSLVWSTDGVTRATDEQVLAAGQVPGGVWCVTTHLSIFAALSEIILGCLNVELLNPEAMRAVVDHHGWWEMRSSIVMFCIVGALFLCLLLGFLHEHYALRYGRTQLRGRSMTSCSQLRKLGLLRLGKLLMAGGVETYGHPKIVRAVQHCLAVRSGVSWLCVARHCWNGAPWVDSPASLPKKVLCDKLYFHSGGVEYVIENDLKGNGPLQILKRFVLIFLATHPLLDAMRVSDLSTSCAKRVTLVLVGIFGVLAVNAMIFNFAGAVRSWETSTSCPIDPASHWFIFVSVLVSAILNVLPNLILLEIAHQSIGRPLLKFIFWLWTIGYMVLAGGLVIIALANLEPRDEHTWHAGLEYSMVVRLLAFPAFQALRHTLSLEYVLRGDHTNREQYLASFGIRDKREKKLSESGLETAERLAAQAISAEELVNFVSLLGDTVMPDYDPYSSTSEDVIDKAIRVLSMKAPSFSNMPGITVEVVRASGLHLPPQNHPAAVHLGCSILHLGKQSHLQRPCQDEFRSSAALATVEGPVLKCTWGFEVNVPGLLLREALGFTVTDRGRIIGVAALPVQDILQGRGFSGDLVLHRPTPEQSLINRMAPKDGNAKVLSMDSFTMPTKTGVIGGIDLAGSKGETSSKLSVSQLARLFVKVTLSPGYAETIALHERWKQRLQRPQHISEVPTEDEEVQKDVLREMSASEFASNDVQDAPATSGVSSAFCEPVLHKEGFLPPDRMVVHSRRGNFCHFVASVLADTLEEQGSYDKVKAKLIKKDFHGLLDMLRAKRCAATRFWIDMFATDLVLGHHDLTGKPGSHWHEQLLAALPTIIRCLRKAGADQITADIKARRTARVGLLVQVLVLDQDYTLTHAGGSLAEMMLAKFMRVRQRLVLHPLHLKGPGLGEEMSQVQKKMKAVDSGLDQAWTLPYLEDQDSVKETLHALVCDGVKEQRDASESTWKELALGDIYATVAAVQAYQTAMEGVAENLAAVSHGGLDILQG